MKILMINGSPSKPKSTSGYLLDQIEKKISEPTEIVRLNQGGIEDVIDRIPSDRTPNDRTPNDRIPENSIQKNSIPKNCDAIIFAFPLYFDAIPSSFLATLKKLETIVPDASPGAKVYTVINNAFYEPINNRYAVSIIINWCRKANITFGGAMCVGAGIIAEISPPGVGPMKNLGIGIDTFTDAINCCGKILDEDIYIEPNYPRAEYVKSCNENWNKAVAKIRGLTMEGLRSKPYSM